MALGAVQSGYAGETCAYRKRESLQEEFYSNFSSMAQMVKGEPENDGKVIGFAAFPCGDSNTGYGMKAQYAAESTPENPVIQVTADYGGEKFSCKVNVNEVNPWNASQLEMFALLSYSDDQGISDGGAFGSYHRLKVYSDNAQMNGLWEGNESWEDFGNTKYDWSAIVVRMAEDYSRAGVYSQYLNAMNLNETLSYFCIRHVDFENVKIVDKTADTFSRYELNIPRNLLDAWMDAVAESGADSLDNDMLSHLDSAMIRRFSQIREENPAGDPLEAALRAAREALQDLGHSLAPELENVSEVQKELENQKALYQSFIRKLERLQEKEKGNHTEAAGKSTGVSGETDDNDLMQLIRERMEELLAMIKRGDAEASFQIGNSSFTIKEWEKFLERFDDIEDAIRELMRERIEKRKEEAEEETERKSVSHEAEEGTGEQEKASRAVGEAAGGKVVLSEKAEEIDALVSESTRCTYPASAPDQEDIMYITWYTEEGIFCRKAGQRQGYEWSIRFENKEDYSRVMEFLDRFDRKDNLRFAARRNFWKEFLKGEIAPEKFADFYEGTDSGVA